MTPKQQCKELGLKDVKEMSLILEMNYATIQRWPKTRPALWQACIIGAAEMKKRQEVTN